MNALALTSLIDFWPAASDLRYLGCWCLLPDHVRLWREQRDRVLPNPWLDRTQFKAAANQVHRTTGKLVRFLGEILDDALGTQHSNRYWNIVLWVWANWFTAETFDRYTRLVEAHDLLGSLDTVGISPYVRLEIAAFREKLQKELFELHRFSLILHLLGVPFESRACPETWLDPATRESNAFDTAPDNRAHDRPLHGADPGDVLVGFLQYRRDATADIFSGSNTGTVRSFEGPEFDFEPRITAVADPDLRAKLTAFPFQGEFEKLLSQLLPHYVPVSLLEGFASTRDYVLSRFSGLPRMIVSGLGCQESPAFTFLSAEAAEAGARLVGTQHAATYNTYRFLPARDFELSIADHYLTWGPLPSAHAKTTTMPAPALSHHLSARGMHIGCNDARHVVFFANQFVPYLNDFRSSVRAHGADRYFEWQLRFFDSLPEEIRSQVILRVKGDRHSKLHHFLRRYLPEITIESKEVPFDDRIRSCRVAVCDCLTQVYAECMMLVPTVLFWDPLIWEQSTQGEARHSALRQAGIYWDSPEAAALHLRSIITDPDAWWRQPAVASARNEYLQALFHVAPDWRRAWANELEKQWRLCDGRPRKL